MTLFEHAQLRKLIDVVKTCDHRAGSVETRRYEATVNAETVELYVKPLTATALANEVASAWCGRQLSVSCPTPCIVDGGDHWTPQPGHTLFGTRASSLGTYSALNADQKQAVFRAPGFAETFVLDVLVANNDRVGANFLWEQKGYFAFDHDQAFLGKERPQGALANVKALPVLFQESELCLDWNGDARHRIRDVAAQWSNQPIDFAPLMLLSTCCPGCEIGEMIDFLTARKSVLVELVEAVLKRCS